ncbi:hypothetical protein OPKNFCMD_5553 [Methylobacterium crusticola]|uniref:Uncharacterized protein n=1 Tax=Methylobacterium crusticola TaxID=1697972 RepID=A0ABQ4R518_9HYPH|nr:hypothetical protein [Methylobacterium crusticola]GJD52786.1 hypothetical protein OPKNFCMD_5553 [Methylobacterium crusticola]
MRRPSRGPGRDWRDEGGSSYHPGDHAVSWADAAMGLLLYACLLGALAAAPERTAAAAPARGAPPDSAARASPLREAGC